MKPGHQRVKGADFERRVANDLRGVFPEARRGLGQARGAEQCDVEGTPLWIEAKHHIKVDVTQAYAQACRDTAKAGCGIVRPPVVVWRNNRGPIQVTMTLWDLANMTGQFCEVWHETKFLVTVAYVDWLEALKRRYT